MRNKCSTLTGFWISFCFRKCLKTGLIFFLDGVHWDSWDAEEEQELYGFEERVPVL